MSTVRSCSFQVAAVFVFAMIFFCTSAYGDNVLVVGLNLPLSGDRVAEGEISRQGAELAQQEINANGGIKIGNELYRLDLAINDNESSIQKAVPATIELITKEKAVGVIGPIASSTAIPAANICQAYSTPMITPTSTNPKTTLNKPYVFRAIALDTFLADVLADFTISEFGATKAAILYDASSAYPRGMAKFFKNSFETRKGEHSVVAFEDFLGKEKDLTHQLEVIVDSDADFLFLPQYAHEVPSIVGQARAMGWQKPIIGGDAWESADLTEKCGELCHGLFYGSHFSSEEREGKSGRFIESFVNKYQKLPNFYAALSYDSVQLLVAAISRLDHLDKNLVAMRTQVKNELAAIKQFEGVAGLMVMNSQGDPTKSGIIMKINDKSMLEAYKRIMP